MDIREMAEFILDSDNIDCPECGWSYYAKTMANAYLSGLDPNSEKHIKDFEALALEWQRNYGTMKHKLEVEIEHLNQVIEELEQEKTDERSKRERDE